MAGLDEQMDVWLNQVRRLVPNTAQKLEMTGAGAEVLQKRLEDVTRKEHYNSRRKTGKVKHLADSITTQNIDMDNVVNGNSVVGFEKADAHGFNHARIARFLNDGTKKMVGDNFHTNAVRDSAKEVLTAEQAVYHRMTGGG